MEENLNNSFKKNEDSDYYFTEESNSDNEEQYKKNKLIKNESFLLTPIHKKFPSTIYFQKENEAKKEIKLNNIKRKITKIDWNKSISSYSTIKNNIPEGEGEEENENEGK